MLSSWHPGFVAAAVVVGCFNFQFRPWQSRSNKKSRAPMVRPRIWLRCRSRVHFPLCVSVMAWLVCPTGVSARIRRALVAERQLPCWSGDQAVADSLLPCELARPPHGVSFLSCRLLRWLFVEALASYLPEYSFALHLFLQDAKRLNDVVVSDEYLQACYSYRVTSAQMVRNANN